MPQYLAKNYLTEHLNARLQFLTQTLLTVPSHLEFVSNYVHTTKNRCKDLNTNILNELNKQVIDQDSNDLILSDLKVSTSTSSKIVQIEKYCDQKRNDSKNIIQIDSDSDGGFNSSYGSSIMGDLDQEVYNSIVAPSFCSKELKKESADYTGYLLEELEEFDSSFHSTIPLVSMFCKRLRPVRVADPFASGRDSHSEVIELVSEEDKTKVTSTEMSFQRITFDQVSDSLFIDETLVKSNQKDCESVNVVMESLKPVELAESETVKDVKILCAESTLNTTKLESFTVTEQTSYTTKYEPMEEILLTDNTHTLDSPYSDCGSILCGNHDELPNLCDKMEEVDELDKMDIVSPTSIDCLIKKVWDEDKVFGDMLLMLLPDDVNEKSQFDAKPIGVPSISSLEASPPGNFLEESLDWDPMADSATSMKSAILSIMCRVDVEGNEKSTVENIFSPIKVNTEVPEQIFEDWKVEDRKLQSLQYITSCKKPYAGDGIPDIKSYSHAPVGYHKPVFQEKSRSSTIHNENQPTPNQKLLRQIVADAVILKTPSMKQYQSPLDSFMLLRTGQPSKQMFTNRQMTALVPPVKNVTAAKIRPMMRNTEISHNDSETLPHNFTENSLKETPSTFHNTQLSSNKSNANQKEMQHPTIQKQNVTGCGQVFGKPRATIQSQSVFDIKLSKEYSTIIDAIDRDSWSLLQFLKDSKCIDEDAKLLLLSTDMTRFLVKEELKKQSKGLSDKDVLRGVLCLHALTQVVDLVLHCNIPTACAVLKSFNLEHESIFRNCLEPVRKKLSIFHCRNEDNKKTHPKLEKIQQILSRVFKADQDSKILILINRYFECVAPNLQLFLCSMKDVTVNLYPTRDVNQDVYMETFYKANVILAQESEELQSCPWEYFQYVIQFEYRKDSLWHEMAYNSNKNLIDFVSLNVLSDVLCEPITDEVSTSASHGHIEHTIICTKQVITNEGLLIALENKENIKVIVKNYAQLNVNKTFTYQPDILIDERTGILVLDDPSMIDRDMLLKKLLSVVLKCCIVHIMFFYNDPTSPKCSTLLSHTAGLLTQIHSKFCYVKCKVWHIFSSEQLAETIRKLCDVAMENTKVWSKDQWLQRTWLSEECTKNEIFLMSFPFMNTFCAQIMMQLKKPLKEIIQMSLEELNKYYKWIPQHVLMAFFTANNHISNNALAVPAINLINDKEIVEQDMSYSNCRVNVPIQDTVKDDYRVSVPIEDIINKENKQNIYIDNQGVHDIVDTCKSSSEPCQQQENLLINEVDFINESANVQNFDNSFANKRNKSSSSSGYESLPSYLLQSDGMSDNNCDQSLHHLHTYQDITPHNDLRAFQSHDNQYGVEMQSYKFNQDLVGNYIIDEKLGKMNQVSPAIGNSTKYSMKNNNHLFGNGFGRNMKRHNFSNEDIQYGQHAKLSSFSQNPYNNKENFPLLVHDGSHGYNTAASHVSQYLNSNQTLADTQRFYNDHPDSMKQNKHSFNPLWGKDVPAMKNVPRQAVKAFHVERADVKNETKKRVKPHVLKGLPLNVDTTFQKNREQHFKDCTTPKQMKYESRTPMSVSMSSNKKRRLTIERVPGASNGQTRLTFL